MNVEQDLVEAVARAICRARGRDPDHRRTAAIPVRRGSGHGHIQIERLTHAPAWEDHKQEARAALAAIRKAGYSLTPSPAAG